MDNKRWWLWGTVLETGQEYDFFLSLLSSLGFLLNLGHSSSVLSLPSGGKEFQQGGFNTLVAFLQLFSSVETPGRGSRKLSLGKKLSCFCGSPVTPRILCV